jgi:hypothetical protein
MARRSGTHVNFAISSAAPSVSVPSGAAANDIAIIDICINPASTTISAAPSGFSLDATDTSGRYRLARYWKRLTGADTGTYDFTLSTSSDVMFVCTLFTGRVTSGSPFDVTTTSAAGVANSLPPSSISPVTAGVDLIASFGTWDNGYSSGWIPSGWSAPDTADYLSSWIRENQSAGSQSSAPVGAPTDTGWCDLTSALLPAAAGAVSVPFRRRNPGRGLILRGRR